MKFHFYRFIIIALFLMTVTAMTTMAAVKTISELRSAWYLFEPYQYNSTIQTQGVLTGLDIQLAQIFLKKMDVRVVFNPLSWPQQQLNIREGLQDIATSATYTNERAQYAYFSVPFRFEENTLFVKRKRTAEFNFDNVESMLKMFEDKKFKVGIVKGFIYADASLNEWLRKPEHQDQIVIAADDNSSIENLLSDKIDCFIVDRIVGATLVLHGNYGHEINEVNIGIRTPIHFMFSKKTIPIEFVERFNKVIEAYQKTDEYTNLISWYLHPVFLLQTAESEWFKIIDYIGTIAFAISGLVIAYRDRCTLFGAFIFALLPSVGGGIIRDVIFSRQPVGLLQSPTYLLLVIGTVLLGYGLLQLAGKRVQQDKLDRIMFSNDNWAQHILVACDALGLAAFTVTGIIVSVLVKASPLWLWGAFFSFLTGAGGGILRDVLSRERFIMSISGTSPYAEIAVLWGFFLAIYLQYQSHDVNPDLIQIGVIVTIVGAFLTRMIFYKYKVPNIYFTYNDKT